MATNPTPAQAPQPEEFSVKRVWKLLLRLLGVTLSTTEKLVVSVDHLADASVALTGMAKDSAEDLRTKSALEADADFKKDMERINNKRKAQKLPEATPESKASKTAQTHL